MKPYKAQSIEKKWQAVWEASGHPKRVATKGKYYVLDMFPYPSGDGLHVGHVENYTATDILSRYKRMQGFNVLHPIGWDAFGLPAENFAIKTGIHPDQKTHENITNFTRQIKSLGMSYDWDREIDTSSPEYYKWTQWMFLFLYKNGLAYKKKAHVNWCPSCQTVLANEQVIDGKCDRCKSEVVQKDLEQWFFKITDFVEDMEGVDGKKIFGLLSGLEKVDWPHSTQAAQRNWIGRSVGTTVQFPITNPPAGGQDTNKSQVSNSKDQKESDCIEVFTTRVDTIFGCTYVVVAPEHPLVSEQLAMNSEQGIQNKKEVEEYLKETKKKTDLERTELNKSKTGVKLEGIEAINPFTGESVPVFVADYVLGNYGTGAVMAVPAHDERDYEFAKKYDLLIKQSIAPYIQMEGECTPRKEKETTSKDCVTAIIFDPSGKKVLVLRRKKGGTCVFPGGGIEKGETAQEAIVREVREETGYKNFAIEKVLIPALYGHGFKPTKDVNCSDKDTVFVVRLQDEERDELSEEEHDTHEMFWESVDRVKNIPQLGTHHAFMWEFFEEGEHAFCDDGIVVDSGEYTGLNSMDATEKTDLKSTELDKASFEKTAKTLELLKKINTAAREKGLKIWVLGGLACAFHAGVVYREQSDLDLIAKDEDQFKAAVKLLETLGLKKKSEKKLTENLTNIIFEDENGFQIDLGPNKWEFGLVDADFEEEKMILNGIEALVISKRFVTSFKESQLKSRSEEKDRMDIEYLRGKNLTENGVRVNSGEFIGLKSEEAREKMTAWLEEKGFGAKKVNYRLRDWLISRQRYWGAPIPIIYCDTCGSVPVPGKDLPVKLPTDVDFRPTGESPLLRSGSFQNVSCPTCGKKARREADTMDTFVCSSWYYLRFADPKNTEKFADTEKLAELLPVDFYMGGAEHTVLHLLYARFFTKALAKYGYLQFDEPFAKLRHQGMVLAEDGRKMSKSLGNVVNPDVVVGEFGADTLRLYEMFMGPLEDMKSWNTGSIVGLRRFLEKVWKLQEKATGNMEQGTWRKGVELLLYKTIKKVTEDIEELKYNTAISSLMILVNAMEKEDHIPYPTFNILLLLLSPFAPHIAEELWENIGNKESIFLEKWPEYDEKLMADEMKTIVVQVNGKVRANLPLPTGSTEEVVKEAALSDENVRKHLDGKEIRKVVYIQDKILNLVV